MEDPQAALVSAGDSDCSFLSLSLGGTALLLALMLVGVCGARPLAAKESTDPPAAGDPGPAATEGEKPPPSGQARPPQVHALLLNGGGSAANNYLSHLHHLQ